MQTGFRDMILVFKELLGIGCNAEEGSGCLGF
jgi:hypothetical protein